MAHITLHETGQTSKVLEAVFWDYLGDHWINFSIRNCRENCIDPNKWDLHKGGKFVRALIYDCDEPHMFFGFSKDLPVQKLMVSLYFRWNKLVKFRVFYTNIF